jgi:hypothetical protein
MLTNFNPGTPCNLTHNRQGQESLTKHINIWKNRMQVCDKMPAMTKHNDRGFLQTELDTLCAHINEHISIWFTDDRKVDAELTRVRPGYIETDGHNILLYTSIAQIELGDTVIVTSNCNKN